MNTTKDKLNNTGTGPFPIVGRHENIDLSKYTVLVHGREIIDYDKIKQDDPVLYQKIIKSEQEIDRQEAKAEDVNSLPYSSINHKEHIAELLKERIYATLALLAVLISIDTNHTDPLHAVLLVCGTIISLWAASLVATFMSRRVIFQGDFNEKHERDHQLRKHAPMLATLVFPVVMISLAALQFITLGAAIAISILSALALLIGWSAQTARSLQAKKLPIILLIAIELALGLGVVGIKVALGH